MLRGAQNCILQVRALQKREKRRTLEARSKSKSTPESTQVATWQKRTAMKTIQLKLFRYHCSVANVMLPQNVGAYFLLYIAVTLAFLCSNLLKWTLYVYAFPTSTVQIRRAFKLFTLTHFQSLLNF
jgi:hypothetical protein